MQVTITQTSNTLTPQLRALYKSVSDKQGLHSAIGLGLVSIAKRAFNDASLRPATWVNKKDGTPSRLRDTGTLAKSIRMTAVSARGVTIGSDRRYAAIHQLGGKTAAHIIKPKNGKALAWPGAAHPGSKIPARPYLPFDKHGKPTAAATRIVEQIIRARVNTK